MLISFDIIISKINQIVHSYSCLLERGFRNFFQYSLRTKIGSTTGEQILSEQELIVVIH